jgi:hypothetical protein
MPLKFAVWFGLTAFALLSATDWLLTYTILNSFPTAIETNPLAAACLEHAGWSGLAVYKVATVLVFVSGTYLLLKRRPPVAAGLVALGCTALVSVTLYSYNLISTANRLTENGIPADVVWTRPERCLPPIPGQYSNHPKTPAVEMQPEWAGETEVSE